MKVLNARFADWYYVISAESFESLRQGRKTLVKPKADEASKTGEESPSSEGDAGLPEETSGETKTEPAQTQPEETPAPQSEEKPSEDATSK